MGRSFQFRGVKHSLIGGENDIIQSQSVPTSQSDNKHDATWNWIDKTGPNYWQGVSVLKYASLVKIPNTTLRREISLIKKVKFIKFKEGDGRPSVLS